MCRIYTCLVESIEENKKGHHGSIARAFLARLTSGHRTPAVSYDRSANFTFPSLTRNNWD
jgi:hypothetical protein